MNKLANAIWHTLLVYPFTTLMTIIATLLPTNWAIQRTMSKEADRLAKEVARSYPESKSRNPYATEAEVIRDMFFDEQAFARMPEASRKRVEVCCETIQGFCYMIALDVGKLKGFMNFRSLQFTYYMDKALQAQGFPPQSKQQKERILDTMNLRIDGWEPFTGD